jgi:hypothetical protein
MSAGCIQEKNLKNLKNPIARQRFYHRRRGKSRRRRRRTFW